MRFVDDPMDTWAEGTKHYVASNGKHYAIESSVNAVPAQAQAMIDEALAKLGGAATVELPRPTVVFECTENGEAVSMTPVATFPSGTGYEEALQKIEGE